MWVETQASAQPSFQKLNMDNSCQKTPKIRYYYIFEVLSNFTVFLYFGPNILSRIVEPCFISILIDSFLTEFSSTCGWLVGWPSVIMMQIKKVLSDKGLSDWKKDQQWFSIIYDGQLNV